MDGKLTMRKLFLILSFCCSLNGQSLLSITADTHHSGGGGTNTFTLIQHKNFDSLGQGTGGSACVANSPVCTVTVSSTTAGSLLVAAAWRDDNGAVNAPTASTSQGTWVHCTNCAQFESGAGLVDAWYILSSTGGATTIICNQASTPSFHGCALMEWSYTPGPISFDVSASSINGGASCTACAGPALTITGTKDLFVGSIVPASSCTAVNGAYTNVADFPSGVGYVAAINQATYTAPTYTCSAGVVSMFSMAFK